MSADKFEEWWAGVTFDSPEEKPEHKYTALAAYLAGRKDALEEAAKVCQSHEPKDFTVAGIITRAKCADAILALIDKP